MPPAPDNDFPTVKNRQQVGRHREIKGIDIDPNRALGSDRATAGARWLKVEARLKLQLRQLFQD
jgi:hypothetical protein